MIQVNKFPTLYRAMTFLRPSMVRRAYDFLGVRGAAKMIELKLLGKYASNYCYNKPLITNVEITNRCQLRCTYCYRNNDQLMNPLIGDMSYEDFVRITEVIKGTRRLYLSAGGEPTLHKDLVRMLTYLKESKIAKSYGFITNGMLLVPDYADKILATGLDYIFISLDGSDAETHESLRPGSDFKKITNNIRYLTEHAGKTTIEIFSIMTKTNIESLLNMPILLQSLGVKYFRSRQLMERTTLTKGHGIDDSVKIANLLDRESRKLGIDYRYYPVQVRTICQDPFKRMKITWDGNFTPCCDMKAMGLNKEPFVAPNFWNSREIRDWRKLILNHSYPDICKLNCNIVDEVRTLNY